MSMQTLEVRVKSVTYEADGIHSYDLRLPDGGQLPRFKAGAHIDVKLSNGAVRSYSLINPEHERNRYVIAVALDEHSRGGSRHMYGITPIWCMVQRLVALKRPWQLHYAVRERGAAAFRDELHALDGSSMHLHVDADTGGKVLDVPAIVRQTPANAHLYCCGPTGMLESFELATRERPHGNVHVEYFKARETPAITGGYTVVLAQSKQQVVVNTGQTILDALIAAGLDPARSCSQGVCGTCEVRVLEGAPDHRDLVLTESERAANRTMMICCSGSKSKKLVLDL